MGDIAVRNNKPPESPKMPINFRYPISLPGLLCIGEMVLAVIILICIGSALRETPGAGFIYFTTVVCLIYSFARLVFYVFDLPAQLDSIPSMLVSFSLQTLWATFYLISGAISISGAVHFKSSFHNSSSCYGTAAFFCLLTAICYGFRSYLFLTAYRTPTAQEKLPDWLMSKWRRQTDRTAPAPTLNLS